MTSSQLDAPQAPRNPEVVLRDHLERRRGGDLEGDLAVNYAEQVILLSKGGVFHGREGVRQAASVLATCLTHGALTYDLVHVEGEIGLLSWSARAEDGSAIWDGTDSFVIRGGRIVAQTTHYSFQPGADNGAACAAAGQVAKQAGAELLEDGQEEVFSRTAVEHWIVADPLALGPSGQD